jgi:ADP-ribose pyrophosphatase YjhB (NUDIX family)
LEKLRTLAPDKTKQLPSVQDSIPHLAYDSVIFGFNGKQLKIQVLEYHNTGLFALPGGFVRRSENLNDAVQRGLRERTGLDQIFLEQFYTFGDNDRMQASQMWAILRGNGFEDFENHWMLDRFVSVAYYALINYNEVEPRPDSLSDSINWYAIDELPPLIMDHRDIVLTALRTLRQNLDRKLVGMSLLPEKFTMKELQEVYEAYWARSCVAPASSVKC